MIIKRSNPQGIDIAIQKLQAHLHTSLIQAWGLQDSEYHCFDRCYRNQDTTGGYTAEVYDGSTGNYREVYYDDALKATSFFGIGPKVTRNLQDSVEVHLVFFVNLEKLKPTATHRPDEEVRIDVLKAIGKDLFGFEYKGLELYLENVLREYPGTRRDALKYCDMHPKHTFRLNYTLTIKQTKIC